ncbi:MAG: AIPR family protein [Thiohalomonadales bacterium]
MTIAFDDELKRSIREIQSDYPELKPDQAFVLWFLQAFVIDDPAVALKAVAGGANDKNMDAIYVDDVVRSVYIVQGKYRRNFNKRESRSDLIAFSQIATLLNGSSQQFRVTMQNIDSSMRPMLEGAREALKRKKYQLALQFVTTGKVSDQHTEEAQETAGEFEGTTFQVFDHNAMHRLMQDYIDGAAPPIPTVKLKIEGNEAFDSYDGNTHVTSWVFAMSGESLGNLFSQHGVRVFARNIRGFMGTKTSVNQQMLATIRDSPELFWYYNNGATIICDSAKQVKERGELYLNVANAQIINGQQTTRTLAESQNCEKVKVLVRVNVVPRENDGDFDNYNRVVGQIVKATNSQNAIKPADLISNDAEQIRIEREFRKMGYFYARKSMTKSEMKAFYGARNRQIIKRDDLVMAVASCTIDPAVVRRGKQKFFISPFYEQIFNGRSIQEYLVLYWLYTFGKYVYKGRGPEIGYSRHIVNNQIWKELGNMLNKVHKSGRFIQLARTRKYEQLKPLRMLIEMIIAEAMKCYRANRILKSETETGKRVKVTYAEIDYFKRAPVLQEWGEHWKYQVTERNVAKVERYKKRISDLLTI